MFENLIKITRSSKSSRYNQNIGVAGHSQGNNELEFPSFSHDLLSVKTIKSNHLEDFLEALKCLNERLDVFVADLYKHERNENIHMQYDEILIQLNRKQSQINYLQSYFESLQFKIEAFQKQLEEKEATLKKLEDKKSVFQSKLINLKKSTKRNQLKPDRKLAIPLRSGNSLGAISTSQSRDLTLNLEPIGSNTLSNMDADDEDNFSDWMSLE